MNSKLLLIGGGGHCKSVASTVFALKCYSEIGIVEKNEKDRVGISGIPVIGNDEELPDLYRRGFREAFITVGGVGDALKRAELYNKLHEIGFIIPNIIDPTAVLCESVCFSTGIFIGKNVVINSDTIIQKGAIINTAAVIEHDCYIGEFVHIGPGAVLCGSVCVGEYSHIGAGSVVRQNTQIGSNTIIGIGSAVAKNIPDNVVAYGTPCREAKKL